LSTRISSFSPAAFNSQFCFGSGHIATSHAAPLPSVFFSKNHSFTNVPSFLNTWTRLLARSQT
jgi:hypothetical protein